MADKSDDVSGLFPTETETPIPPLSPSPVAGAAAVAIRGLRKESVSERPTSEKLQRYTLHRAEMIKESRKHGSMHFIPRLEGIPCGLINQGATCYLNSLLQSLFTTLEFRSALYQWKYDATIHGEEKTCIPFQLQRLFSRMELSKRAAVSTKELTLAFGWTGADSFQQHDIQELTCLLLDALEKTSPQHFKSVNALFRGKSCGYVEPVEMTDPSQRHETKEEFIDIQVPVKGFQSLQSALSEVVATEKMEGDNQWMCDELEMKVDAIKGTIFKELPPVLTLHLMRFTFDPVSFRRVKLLDNLKFPQEMNLNFLLDPCLDNQTENTYTLKSILMHSGSADRGHYYAFIKYQGKWACFNDAHCHVLDEKEETAIFEPECSSNNPSDDVIHVSENEENKTSPENLEIGASAEKDLNGSNDTNTIKVSGSSNTSSLKDIDVVSAPHTSRSNAYMLIYQMNSSEESSSSCISPIPQSLQDMVHEENAQWSLLSECFQIHQQMVELVIYPPCALVAVGEGEKAVPHVSVFLHHSTSYQEAVETSKEACFLDEEWLAVVNRDHNSTDQCRLRRFNPHLRRAGETFGTRSQENLISLGLTQHVTMIMELKKAVDDEEWVEFNPNEMSLKLVTWQREYHEAGPVIEIIVPGESEATVGAARFCAAKALVKQEEDIEDLKSLIRLVRVESNRATMFEDDKLSLRKDLNVWPGECLYVEVVSESDQFESDIMNTFLSAQDSITLLVNHIDPPYELIPVPMKRCNSIALLKETIVNLLIEKQNQENLKSNTELKQHLQLSNVHLRRGNVNGVMIKDETKTIHSLSFVDGSVVWLCHGVPCRPDQFMINFINYSPDEKPCFSPLISLAISEKSRISEVKKLLSVTLKVIDPHTLRLRDKKLSAVGSILRDSATVRRSLMNLVDGRQVAVQMLEAPETITADSIILSVRGFRTSTMKFTPATELVVSKTSSLGSLRETIREKFGDKLLMKGGNVSGSRAQDDDTAEKDGNEPVEEENNMNSSIDYFQLAKGLSNGPPLKASGALALKWDDVKWSSDDNCAIGGHPINLRDGSLIYIRSNCDAANAPVQTKKTVKKGRAAPSSWVGPSGRGGTNRKEPTLNITVVEAGTDTGTGAEQLAKRTGATLESAQFALEAAGGDEALARQFLQ